MNNTVDLPHLILNLPDQNAKEAIYNLFIESKYCYNKKPKIYHLTSKVYSGDSIISKDELESEYWLGWSKGLQKVKNIGDPLGFLHYYGLCYANIIYRSKIRNNIHMLCYVCGYHGNVFTHINYNCDKCNSSQFTSNKKNRSKTCIICHNTSIKFIEVCKSCGSSSISRYRFTESLQDEDSINISNLDNYNEYSDILKKILLSLNNNTRAYELLSMFLSHEIEIDSDWKKFVASKWGVSEFRVVLVWRQIKKLIISQISL